MGEGITFSGSSIEIVAFKGEVISDASIASEVVLTWRLAWGVRSVSGLGGGAAGSLGLWVSWETGETGDGADSTFDCSNVIG
jgi:hypothetical protein